MLVRYLRLRSRSDPPIRSGKALRIAEGFLLLRRLSKQRRAPATRYSAGASGIAIQWVTSSKKWLLLPSPIQKWGLLALPVLLGFFVKKFSEKRNTTVFRISEAPVIPGRWTTLFGSQANTRWPSSGNRSAHRIHIGSISAKEVGRKFI